MWVDVLFRYGTGHRSGIILVFKLIYGVVLFFLAFGSWAVVTGQPFTPQIITLSYTSGQCALVLFTIAMIPGIVKRFGMNHKSVALLRIFRRYIGILTFVLAFSHAWFQRLLLRLLGFGSGLLTFELMGLTALILLFPLFLTSNDWSVNRIGIWWFYLHKLVYVIMWFILLHVGLQKMSVWTLVAGILVTTQLVSFGYEYLQKRKSLTVISSS